jgi:hypothetical protein
VHWLEFVEPNSVPTSRFLTEPGRKKVAQLLYNLIKVQMFGNQIGKGGAAAGHGDLEPAALD